MDQLNDLFAWFRINPGKAAGVALALLAAGGGTGTWIASAEDAHRKVPEIVKAVDGLTKLHESAEVEKRVKAEQEAARRAELAKLCAAGTLKDAALCASVGAPIR